MPIIDVYIPESQFDQPAQDRPANDLTRTLLNCDLTHNNPRAPAIDRCYIHKQATASVYIAGEAEHKAHYRIAITIIQAAMSSLVKQQLVEEMTQLILAAEGTAFKPMNAGRVWITFHEIEEGNWAAEGRVYRLEDLMDYLQNK